MTTLIGYRWKCSDVCSRVILITQKFLDEALCKTIFTKLQGNKSNKVIGGIKTKRVLI
jgi:hypothetical protein